METIPFLLDRPFALFIVLAVGAAIGMGVERFTHRAEAAKHRKSWQESKSKRKQPSLRTIERAEKKLSARSDFAAEQLKIVSGANFRSCALLNKPEAKVFMALDKVVIARNPGWQVMAQVSLGEFLSSEDDEAFRAVNSKRVDFALMDERCRVHQVLEYQGSGHHAGNCAAARDAVKKEALRRAGIGYHEIIAGHTTPAELKSLVEKLVPLPPRLAASS